MVKDPVSPNLFARFALGLVNFILAGLAAAMVLGFLGRLDQAFDLLSHFRLHMAVTAAVLAGVLGWVNALRRAALAACVAVLGFAGTLPHIATGTRGTAHATTGPANAAATLRILSYNIQAGIGDHDRILQTIRAAGADLVVLPESWSTFRPAGRLLEALEADYPHRTYCPVASGCSVTLLSRRPLAGVHTLDPGRAWPPAAVARIALGDRTVTVYGVHLVFPLARSAQLDSMRILADALAHEDGPVVLAGDFNAAPWSRAMRDFSRHAGFAAPPGFRPSWPAALGPIGLPIDHIAARAGAVVEDIAVLDADGSDHRPLLATVSLARPE